MTTAAALRAEALARAGKGDDNGAAHLFARAVALFPDDAALMNSVGNFHAGAGRPAEALTYFDRALALAPGLGEAAINRAVVLTRLRRAAEALDQLCRDERKLANLPRYWTSRASAETILGKLAAAAASYDRGLEREPANPRALGGRARVALDRGEPGAIDRYDRALAATPGDPQLLLGLAQALEADGDLPQALAISEALATQLPGWVEGLELHARLRWGAGDRAQFCNHYPAALAQGGTPAHYQSWASMLAGVDRHAAAAEVLADARTALGDEAGLLLAEAVCRGEAGDDDGAMAIFDRFARPVPAWQVGEGRQRLRQDDPEQAEVLLALAIKAAPDDISAWSVRDLCWRLLGDARHEWLHAQSGLIQEVDLGLSQTDVAAVRSMLDDLHDRSAMPIGQSVKDGSQTRGGLFVRHEMQIALIADAITGAITRYRDGLPPADPTHPLLRHRDLPWHVQGSWSIRLRRQGHHAAHVHPAGIISSAMYITVPTEVDDPGQPGWLEIGRPPANLRTALPPLAMIRPQAGFGVLFPSTLYHGTRPIIAGERMTVAFDVGPSGI